MADRIAGFLFEHAIVLMPTILLLGIAVVVLLVRRWPRSIWKRLGSALLIGIAVVVATMAGGLLYAERSIRSVIEHRVSVLTLQPKDGGNITKVADLHGNVVVLNFWATWCGPCRAEMPDLNRMAQRYDKKPVTVLAITDETADRIALFEQKVLPLRMKVATFRSDQPHGAIATMAYGGRPTTVILDRDGRIKEVLIGQQSFERLTRAVDDLL
jgi:thiol-disulfide isomerase/thioredoxin